MMLATIAIDLYSKDLYRSHIYRVLQCVTKSCSNCSTCSPSSFNLAGASTMRRKIFAKVVEPPPRRMARPCSLPQRTSAREGISAKGPNLFLGGQKGEKASKKLTKSMRIRLITG